MKVLCTSDLHQFIPKWRQLVEVVRSDRPELVLIAGDLLPKRGGFRSQKDFFPPMAEHLTAIRNLGSTVLLYLGNDDSHVLEPELHDLERRGLCVNLNCRVWRYRDVVTVCGMPFVRDYPFAYKAWVRRDDAFVTCPVQFSRQGLTMDDRGRWIELESLEAQLLSRPSLREELEALRAQLEPGEMRRSVWMIHNPPAHLGMDICGSGERVGSPAVFDFIRANQPLFGVSGHIHESPYQRGGRWVAAIGPTTVWVQPGQVGERLHCVSLEIDPGLAIRGIRHSVFGHANISPGESI